MEVKNLDLCENKNGEPPTPSHRFSVQFLGSMFMDRMYSQTMQPWVMSEIRRKRQCITEVDLEVVDETICVSSREVDKEDKQLLFEHHLKSVTRFAKLRQDPKCFSYLTRQQLDSDFMCHVYIAQSEEMIPLIFQALCATSQNLINSSINGETVSQSSEDSSSHVTNTYGADWSKSMFEVKYVGQAKVGGKKVTSHDIDSLAEILMIKLEVKEEHTKQHKQQIEKKMSKRHPREVSLQSLPNALEDDLATQTQIGEQKQTLKKSTNSISGNDASAVTADSGLMCSEIPQVLPFPLLARTADSNPQAEQLGSNPRAGQSVDVPTDFQSESDIGGDPLDCSAEHGLGCLDIPMTQLGLGVSFVTGDASQRLQSSTTENGSGAGKKLSFLEHSEGRQLQEISDPQGNSKDVPGQRGSDVQDSGDDVHGHCEAGRVMLLQIGHQEITLISLDKKMAILECKFKDISSVSQGSQRQGIFGVVVRESEFSFICYILRCLSASMVAEIMSTLQMAFASAYSQRGAATTTQHQMCTTCPLYQLHRICQEIHSMSSQSACQLLVKKVQFLPDSELADLNSHMQAEKPESSEESVEVLMIFLRRLCERKQREHVHISDSIRSFRSEANMLEDKHNLFGGSKGKTKRSFTSSLESLLPMGKLNEDGSRALSWATDSDTTSSWASGDSSRTSTPDMSPMSKNFLTSFSSPPSSPGPVRKRSVTLDSMSGSSLADLQRTRRRDVNHNRTSGLVKGGTHPAISSFQQSRSVLSPTATTSQEKTISSAATTPQEKTISSAATTPQEKTISSAATTPQEKTMSLPAYRRQSSSFRKAIFTRVCTPQHSGELEEEDETNNKHHNTDEIRALWRKAFLETLLLIRLEKEYHNVRARQEEGESTLSPKLEYQELTPCLKEITAVWENLLSLPNKKGNCDQDFVAENGKTMAKSKLLECVKKGVPRCLRGQIWLFLIQQQQQTKGAVQNISCSNADYEDLLKQLTTHQHAILIDLGRTFPSHPYFSTSLGPGQLELFNLLKAYSLLDTEVGYCQGLSFIVGMLLMHMEEISAFHVLKYMMYDLGLRKQFRPNMHALQMALYQLTRLLRDHYRDVYDHLEAHEVSPTLYAAPWFLTLFASQFPHGFVARVFDLIFVQGIDALFNVALMLIGNHRALILQCDTFESIVDFLKVTLPEMVQVQMERIINQAFELDIGRELQAYQVEYQVLSEEVSFSPPHQRHRNQCDIVRSPTASVATENPHRRSRRMSVDLEMLYRLEHQNIALKHQNAELLETLEQAQSQRESCEQSIVAHQVERDKLRSHIQALELERAALLTAVANLQQLVPHENLPPLSLSLPAPPPAMSAHPGFGSGRAPCPTGSDLSIGTHPGTDFRAQGRTDGFITSGHVIDTPRAIPQDSLRAATREPPQRATLETPRRITPEPTVGARATAPVTRPLGKEANLALPAPCQTSTEHNAQVTSWQHEPTKSQDHASITAPETNLISSTSTSSSSSLAPPSAAGSTDKRDVVEQTTKTQNSTDQCPSQTDLQTSATVSSCRQTYLPRSISNVAANQPAAGSVTPEERRKSVKVIVQQSTTTRSMQ